MTQGVGELCEALDMKLARERAASDSIGGCSEFTPLSHPRAGVAGENIQWRVRLFHGMAKTEREWRSSILEFGTVSQVQTSAAPRCLSMG